MWIIMTYSYVCVYICIYIYIYERGIVAHALQIQFHCDAAFEGENPRPMLLAFGKPSENSTAGSTDHFGQWGQFWPTTTSTAALKNGPTKPYKKTVGKVILIFTKRWTFGIQLHMNFTSYQTHLRCDRLKSQPSKQHQNAKIGRSSEPFRSSSDAQVEYIVYEAKGGIPGNLELSEGNGWCFVS